MPNSNQKPAIRFAGFTEPWEQRKLGELAAVNPDSVLPESFEYVDLESVVGTSMVSHRREIRGSAPSRAQRLAQTGDIFYQTVRPYQKNNYLFELPDEDYVFSTGYAQLRPNGDARFLFAQLQKYSFVKIVLDNCTGTSYPAINAKDLAEIEIGFPSNIEEQRAIGSFLFELDNLITLHQRKYDKLTVFKKSMLEKMFPKNGELEPEIRFEGFTEPWEQRKLGELASEFQSGDFISASEIAESGSYPVFGGNGIRGYAERYNHEGYYALIGRQGALCGNVNFADGKAYFTEHAVAVKANSGHDTPFLVYMLGRMNLGQYSGQSAQPGLAVGVIKEVKTTVPAKAEQHQIGAFFQQLDKLITLHQRELEMLKKIKQSCLEKMFV